jgi:hypothetical protein
MASDDRFAFTAEWFDTMAGLIRTYTLLYYPSDNTIEMVRIPKDIGFDQTSELF